MNLCRTSIHNACHSPISSFSDSSRTASLSASACWRWHLGSSTAPQIRFVFSFTAIAFLNRSCNGAALARVGGKILNSIETGPVVKSGRGWGWGFRAWVQKRLYSSYRRFRVEVVHMQSSWMQKLKTKPQCQKRQGSQSQAGESERAHAWKREREGGGRRGRQTDKGGWGSGGGGGGRGERGIEEKGGAERKTDRQRGVGGGDGRWE